MKLNKFIFSFATAMIALAASANTFNISSSSDFRNLLDGEKLRPATSNKRVALANGDSIMITGNFTISNPLTLSKDVTIYSNPDSLRTITFSSSASLTITSDATFIDINIKGSGTRNSSAIIANNGSKVIFSENATISQFTGSAPSVTVNAGGKFSLRHMATITECSNTASNGKGGAVYCAGTMVMRGVISNCSASGNGGKGGAIYIADGTSSSVGDVFVDFSGGTIEKCSAESAGGAVFAESGVMIFYSNPTIAGNFVGGVTNNVVPLTDTQIVITNTFIGRVGVTYPTAATQEDLTEKQFGVLYDDGFNPTHADAHSFFNDKFQNIFGEAKLDEQIIIWESSHGHILPDANGKTFDDFLKEVTAEGRKVFEVKFIGDYTQKIVVPSGYEVTFHLNGQKISCDIETSGKARFIDASPARTGEVTGKLTVKDGGIFDIEGGTYASRPQNGWIDADELAVDPTDAQEGKYVILENYDGTFSVSRVVWTEMVDSMPMDTRRGVREAASNDELFAIAFSSGDWVYGASTNAQVTAKVLVVPAVAPEGASFIYHNGTNNVGSQAECDGTFDFAIGGALANDQIREVAGARVLVHEDYLESRWPVQGWHAAGLIKAIHINSATGEELVSYFKYPDVTHTALQRATGTDEQISLSDDYLQSIGFSRIHKFQDQYHGGHTTNHVHQHINEFEENGLRVWENLVLGKDGKSRHAVDLSNKPSGLQFDLSSVDDNASSEYGYRVQYQLRRFDKGRWHNVHEPKFSPQFELAFGNGNPSGLYRFWTLITPNSNHAVTNEIPSTNVIGVLKVESAYTNTVTAVPWLSANVEGTTGDMEIGKLVHPANLNEGDSILAYNDASGELLSWELNGDGEWSTVATVSEKGIAAYGADEISLPRGGAFWMVRRKPSEDSVTNSYYLVGENVSGEYRVELTGGTKTAPGLTLVANPTANSVNLNELIFTDESGAVVAPGQSDTIDMPGHTAAVPRIYSRNSDNTQWGYSKKVYVDGRLKSIWVSDGEIPPGTGFRYNRRSSGKIILTWEGWSEL